MDGENLEAWFSPSILAHQMADGWFDSHWKEYVSGRHEMQHALPERDVTVQSGHWSCRLRPRRQRQPGLPGLLFAGRGRRIQAESE
jgi:hypothetical protein